MVLACLNTVSGAEVGSVIKEGIKQSHAGSIQPELAFQCRMCRMS